MRFTASASRCFCPPESPPRPRSAQNQAALLPHKTVQPHGASARHISLLRRARICQKEVCAYGVVKEKGLTAHMGEGSIIRLPVEAFDRLSVQKTGPEPGRSAPVRSLATVVLPQPLSPRWRSCPAQEHGGYAVQRLPSRCIGKCTSSSSSRPPQGLCLAPCGLRLLQQRQHHSPRADPVHGHMEGASEGRSGRKNSAATRQLRKTQMPKAAAARAWREKNCGR